MGNSSPATNNIVCLMAPPLRLVRGYHNREEVRMRLQPLNPLFGAELLPGGELQKLSKLIADGRIRVE
jgi:hypothetical protein